MQIRDTEVLWFSGAVGGVYIFIVLLVCLFAAWVLNDFHLPLGWRVTGLLLLALMVAAGVALTVISHTLLNLGPAAAGWLNVSYYSLIAAVALVGVSQLEHGPPVFFSTTVCWVCVGCAADFLLM